MTQDELSEVGPLVGRRDRLVECTLQLMQNEGLDATTIDAVVERSGISRDSVRFLFGSFDNLVGEALEELRVRRHERTGRLLAALPPVGSELDAWEEAVDHLASGLVWLHGDGVYPFWELCEQASRRPELAAAAAESMDGLQDQLAQLLLDCGLPRGDLLAPVMYGMVHGAVSYHRIVDQDRDALVQDLAHGLRALVAGHVAVLSDPRSLSAVEPVD